MPPTFAEIEPVSLKDRVINALKDAFLEGQFKPGDAIVERELARQMKVGTPVVREALISLEGQGFVRRVTNTGTFVTKFSQQEVRNLYAFRTELETLALQWLKPRVTEADLVELTATIDDVVDAGRREARKEFLELDYRFHRQCWKLSGNTFLAETLDRLMAPLFNFVVVASGAALTEAMGREHYELIRALRDLEEPEFSVVVRRVFGGFASRWQISIPVDGAPAADSEE
jgi:DNA-binding GntR family transcriptional regulator